MISATQEGAWAEARLDEDEGQVVKDFGMEQATYFGSGWMRNWDLIPP